MYFRCKNDTKFGCAARVISKGMDLQKCYFTDVHNHMPEKHKVDETKFECVLDKNCHAEPFKSHREVYLDTKVDVKGEMDRKNIPGQSRYKSRIYRRHRKTIPKLPTTPEEFDELISDENYSKEYSKDHRGHQFYRGVWSNSLGEKNLAFISETVLKFILTLGAIMLRMDGTFKVLPHHIKFRQLFIISVMFNEHSYPLAYIFMQKKNFHSYDLIMSKLKTMIPADKVTNIMADYEAATRKAAKLHFPNAIISGCYFHYVQAIYKMAKRFGLKKDEKFADAIQKLSALALLPAEFILEGFNVIDQQFKKYSRRWDRVKQYWKRQWRTANISVYGLVDRTNNFAESLNKSINLLIKIRHKKYGIWFTNYG